MPGFNIGGIIQFLLFTHGFKQTGNTGQQFGDVQSIVLRSQMSGFCPSEIEQLMHEVGKTGRLLMNNSKKAIGLLALLRRVYAENVLWSH